MNVVNEIFSFLCSQDAARSFVIAGQRLPFCQRCTGVYVGMGLSLLFLLLSRYHRKGLPPKGIICVNIACLLIMPIFGFHLLDPGPLWRLWSGLIFGNTVIFLLVPAVSVLCDKVRPFAGDGKASTLWFLMFFAFLNTLPLWLPMQSHHSYLVVLALTSIALAGVLFCIVSTVMFWTKNMISILIKRIQ
jgi:hypothetical protein